MGNFINKEWSQHVDVSSSGDESPDHDSDLLGKGKGHPRRNSIFYNDSTPVSNKVMVAEFDPRSPSNGIVRTPISYMNEKNEAKKLNSLLSSSDSNPPKYSITDPRSPTSEYSRTPIHINTAGSINKIDLNQSNDFLNDSSSSLDNSSLVMSESSILLQQVPENLSNNANSGLVNGNDPSGQFGLKIASSNMPRHILQRKQVEKLNKKKLIDYNDKENN